MRLVFILVLFSSLSCSHYRTIPGSSLSSLSLLRRIVHIKSDSTSTLIGQVLDRDSDEPIYGVNVVINDLIFGSTTDTTGNYIIKDIPKGTYKIKTSWVGYKTAVFDSIEIEGGELIILDFRLAREEMKIND